MKKILIINGPNLNLLGLREPDIYGSMTLEDIKDYTNTQIKKNNLSVDLDWYQSNIEGELVEYIQSAINSDYDALILNPAAYSHTSVAMLDALKMIKIPIIEVHLTNVYSREEFRQTLLTARAASKIMSGLGKDAYYLAVMSELI
jgi:3-dehydroquinate dehydratase-2